MTGLEIRAATAAAIETAPIVASASLRDVVGCVLNIGVAPEQAVGPRLNTD